MKYELIYGTADESEMGMLDIELFDTEAEALKFVDDNEPEVAQLNYPDGTIYVISE